MALLGTSNFSIRKLIDGKTLTFSLSANTYTQIMSKDPTKYVPDFTVTAQNLKIIPSLYESGGGSANKVTSAPRWFINTEELQGTNGTTNKTKWGAEVTTTGNYQLVIRKNLTVNSLVIRSEYDYVDPVSAASTTVVQEISIARVENAGTTILALIDCPQDTFVTHSPGVAPADLTLTGRLIRGGSEDTTLVTYKWYVRSYTDGTYKQITGAEAPAGAGLPSGTLFSGASGKTLTVKAGAVINVGSFMFEATDTDPSSSTSNKKAATFYTLFDMSDPYAINIDLPQGDGVSSSSSVLAEFQVWQKGAKVPDTFYTSKTLSFSRNAADGSTDATWVPSPSFAGWTVAAGKVSRTYSAAALGTKANRSVTITDSHLLTNRAMTVFNVQIDG